jgi:hypothetical protein
MPTHAEELEADRARFEGALLGLVAEQEIVVRNLEEELATGRSKLDRAVLKLRFYSEHFGRSSTDTTLPSPSVRRRT